MLEQHGHGNRHDADGADALTRRQFLGWAAAATGASAIGSSALGAWGADATGPPPGARRPNIVLVVADDMGRQLGCYGDAQATTPHLDAFAHEGVLFRNAYITSASCSPSRASMLTGLHPHQHGQIGLSHTGFAMDGQPRNLPHALREAGYYTGVFGKIHVKPQSLLGFDFKYGGFDYTVDGESTVKTDQPVSIIDHRWNEKRTTISTTQTPDLVDAHTGRFFDQAGDEPFFLMVNLHDPHPPYYHQVQNVPADPKRPNDMQRFDFIPPDEPFHANAAAAYHNGVTRVDHCFGLVREQLRRRGLDEHTLIIFTSDHGPNFGHHGKGTCYEAGLRVPMIARFPHTQMPNEITADVSALDLLPTALDLIGRPRRGLPGQSLLRHARGQWRPRDYVFGQFNFHVPNMLKPMRSIRGRRYKLIHNPLAPRYARLLNEWGRQEPRQDENWRQRNYRAYARTPEFELYDLQADPHEFHNLADDPEHAATRKRLLRELRAWQRRTDDFLIDDERAAALREEGEQLLRAVFAVGS